MPCDYAKLKIQASVSKIFTKTDKICDFVRYEQRGHFTPANDENGHV